MAQTCSDWVLCTAIIPAFSSGGPWMWSRKSSSAFMSREQFLAKLHDIVWQQDPNHRPLADGSPGTDIVAWGQPPSNKVNGKLDNLAPLQNAAGETTKPLLCKEIYGGFRDVPAMLQFSGRITKRLSR